MISWLFSSRISETNGRNWRKFVNFSKTKILDLEAELLSEFSNFGMVGLVVEWVVGFCEFRRIPKRGPEGRV